MKNLLVFSFCFLALVNCGDIKRENFVRSDGADNRKNAYTWEDYNLTENVDSVHTIKSRPILNSDFTTYQNDTTKMLTYSSFLKFDKKGRLTQGNYLSYDNFSLGKEEYIISENGKIETLNTSKKPWKIILAQTGIKTQTAGRLKKVSKYLSKNDY